MKPLCTMRDAAEPVSSAWPDALAAEFSSRNVEFSQPLKDDDDGLRGFELKDADGYVLFFGRPRS
jgi:hypothetical protein